MIHTTIKRFLESYTLRKKSQNTVDHYDDYLTYFREWAGITQAEAVTFELVEAYRRHLASKDNGRGETLKSNTQAYYLIALKMFLKYCRLTLGMDVLDHHRIQLPDQPSADIVPVPVEDIRRMLDQPMRSISRRYTQLQALRDTAIMAVLWDTGLRVSEISRLNVEHARPSFSIRGKGSKPYLVHISAPILTVLKRYLTARPDAFTPMFIDHLATPDPEDPQGLKLRLSVRTIQRMVKRHGTDAGVRNIDAITPHAFRHTFCTDLIRNGASLPEVQKAANHSSPMTTAKYTHIVDPHLASVHAKYHTNILETRPLPVPAYIQPTQRLAHNYTVSSTADFTLND